MVENRSTTRLISGMDAMFSCLFGSFITGESVKEDSNGGDVSSISDTLHKHQYKLSNLAGVTFIKITGWVKN